MVALGLAPGGVSLEVRVTDMATVHRLPGTDSTPQIMLGQLLGLCPQIESLVVTVKWKEAGHQVCWTAQSLGALAMAGLATHDKVTREIMA